MNNRYLCHAKRIDNGELVEGLLTIMWGQFHIINPDDENTAYPIDESTICRCTGLEDKHSKLIFENDIVKHFYNKDEPERYDIGVVQWDDVHLRFKRTSKTDEKCVDISFYSVYEVIGSVFDNPELLEVGE